jgi:hypothetical protein
MPTKVTTITVTVVTISPVDYSKNEVPAEYKCCSCRATNCKLWREFNTCPVTPGLKCAPCAAASEKRSISDIDAAGMRTSELGCRTDQIGFMMPAIPTEDGEQYWGYTSVPHRGVEWWKRLPTLPEKK